MHHKKNQKNVFYTHKIYTHVKYVLFGHYPSKIYRDCMCAHIKYVLLKLESTYFKIYTQNKRT